MVTLEVSFLSGSRSQRRRRGCRCRTGSEGNEVQAVLSPKREEQEVALGGGTEGCGGGACAQLR